MSEELLIGLWKLSQAARSDPHLAAVLGELVRLYTAAAEPLPGFLKASFYYQNVTISPDVMNRRYVPPDADDGADALEDVSSHD